MAAFKITPNTPLVAEDRGHGIVALYVTGPANEYRSIERAVNAYARANLGVSGPVSGGGTFLRQGASVELQMIYVTRPCTPRTD